MLTVEKVKDGIYQLGYYPALVFLKEQEELENYQECKTIKEALDQIGNGRDWYLSSRVDNESLEITYNNVISNRTILAKNMPYYIEEFKKLMSA